MIIALLIIGYILTVLWARKVTRDWHVRSGYNPDLSDVVGTLIPIVNIVMITVYSEVKVYDVSRKYFGIKESK
jgi:hypothetical protein